jgi:hypothetical protein
MSLLQDGMIGMEARDRGRDCAQVSHEFGLSGSSVDIRPADSKPLDLAFGKFQHR